MIADPVAASRFPVGSSANRTCGRGATARARATRCCSPPDNWAGKCPDLWPNPGKEHVYLNVSDMQVKQIQIVSSQGQVLRDYKPREGTGILDLDVSAFHSGLYVVLIEAVQGSYSQKLLITK